MSELKATPGPWLECISQEGLITSSSGKDICEITPTYGDVNDELSTGYTCEQLANRDLIIASRDMYDVLDAFPGFTSTTVEKAEWARRVIKAKRKARGE